MEESLRRSLRPQVISLNSSNSNSAGTHLSRGGPGTSQKNNVISPVQNFTKAMITPSLSEQKRRQLSGNSLQQHQSGYTGSRTMIKDPLPQRVQALQNFFVEKVFCGSDQTFVITAPFEADNKHCFSWGCNSHAQLGHSFEVHADSVNQKSSMQKVLTPTLIEGLEGENITHITCGNSHAFAWSVHDQVVFGWGNGANGRLGNETEEIVPEPKVLQCFREGIEMGLLSIRAMSCGENHTLALIDVDVG